MGEARDAENSGIGERFRIDEFVVTGAVELGQSGFQVVTQAFVKLSGRLVEGLAGGFDVEAAAAEGAGVGFAVFGELASKSLVLAGGIDDDPVEIEAPGAAGDGAKNGEADEDVLGIVRRVGGIEQGEVIAGIGAVLEAFVDQFKGDGGFVVAEEFGGAGEAFDSLAIGGLGC